VGKQNERLVIVGKGYMKNELKVMAADKSIEFRGYLPKKEIRKFMCKNGKILVLPAIRGEGLPNVILEAMSVGIPSVATSIAGIPDLVKNGKTGFLVKPGNSEELRKAIQKLSRDEKLRRIMGSNCLREIKKYYWDNVIRQLEKIIFSISGK
jgi:glycosyltransferase involved in cell wall biosynthesis